MSPDEIKSGPQVVGDFLESVKDNPKIDRKVTEAISELLANGKLSKTRLQNALQALRDEMNTPHTESASGKPK